MDEGVINIGFNQLSILPLIERDYICIEFCKLDSSFSGIRDGRDLLGGLAMGGLAIGVSSFLRRYINVGTGSKYRLHTERYATSALRPSSVNDDANKKNMERTTIAEMSRRIVGEV